MGSSQPRRIEEHVVYELGIALLMLVVVLIQVTLLPRPFGITINVLLILIVCHTLISGPIVAARWAFYGGLWLDICSASALGTHALALLAAVLLVAPALARLNRSNWVLPLAGMALGTLAYHTVLGVLWWMLHAAFSFQHYGMIVVLPSLVIVFIPTLPMFLLMRWWQRRQRGEVPIDIY